MAKEKEIRNAELYEKIIRYTWFMEATGTGKDGTITNSYFTGFNVGKGLIMTCAHGVTDIVQNLQIQARKLRSKEGSGYKVELGDGFRKVTLVNVVPELDLGLLKLVDSDENEGVAEFGDGELRFGQEVVHVGNLEGVFTASCLTGNVAFKCTNDVILPTDNRKCCDFVVTPSVKRLPYRIFGHAYHRGINWEIDDDSLQHMHPLLPIIQVNRMQGGQGCSGGPLCDTEGKVVGLLFRRASYVIAIHVSMMKEFLRRELQKLEACGQSNKP